MRLCSACLLGIKCRFDGKSKPNEKIIKSAEKEILIPVCPEQLGGLSTPRPNAEIINGDGLDVLEGRAKIIDSDNNDVTEEFVRGAKEVLKLAKIFNIKEVILKQRSPSCGCGQIYDGSFSKRLIEGNGVTTALLQKEKINIISDEKF